MNLDIEVEETAQQETEIYFSCALCGRTLYEKDKFIFDDVIMCQNCLNNHTFICYECEGCHWNKDGYAQHRSKPLCEKYYDDYYLINGGKSMEITRLQDLYWQSQTLHDKMFSLECHIHKLKSNGKNPRKTYEKYFELLNELRSIKTEMILIETA